MRSRVRDILIFSRVWGSNAEARRQHGSNAVALDLIEKEATCPVHEHPTGLREVIH